MPSVFKELCRPMNSNSAQYHESATYHHLEPESADADTHDGKDGGEKEAETYENVFEYLTKGCYPQGASKADKSVLRRMSKKFQVMDGILHYSGKEGQLRQVNCRLLSWKVVGFSFSMVDFVHQLVE